MLESFILVDHSGVGQEALRSLSFQNAKQIVLGGVPGQFVLHVAATTDADLNAALIKISGVSGVTGVSLLTLRRSR
jgi:hypothetical protein